MVAWTSEVETRVPTHVPVSVDTLKTQLELLLLYDIGIDVYTSFDQLARDNPGTRGFGSSYCHNFFDLGGVILGSPLAKKFHSRKEFLLDSCFWRLWDVIVMGGWFYVSMPSFRSVYDCDDVVVDFFMPLLPMSVTPWDYGLKRDELSYHRVGYNLFSDILNLFRHFVRQGRWGFGSELGPASGSSSLFLQYQFKLLGTMISRSSQLCDILHVVLDLNLWGCCHASTICYIGYNVADDSLDTTQYNAMMLVLRSSLIFSVTSSFCDNILKYCVI